MIATASREVASTSQQEEEVSSTMSDTAEKPKEKAPPIDVAKEVPAVAAAETNRSGVTATKGNRSSTTVEEEGSSSADTGDSSAEKKSQRPLHASLSSSSVVETAELPSAKPAKGSTHKKKQTKKKKQQQQQQQPAKQPLQDSQHEQKDESRNADPTVAEAEPSAGASSTPTRIRKKQSTSSNSNSTSSSSTDALPEPPLTMLTPSKPPSTPKSKSKKTKSQKETTAAAPTKRGRSKKRAEDDDNDNDKGGEGNGGKAADGTAAGGDRKSKIGASGSSNSISVSNTRVKKSSSSSSAKKPKKSKKKSGSGTKSDHHHKDGEAVFPPTTSTTTSKKGKKGGSDDPGGGGGGGGSTYGFGDNDEEEDDDNQEEEGLLPRNTMKSDDTVLADDDDSYPILGTKSEEEDLLPRNSLKSDQYIAPRSPSRKRSKSSSSSKIRSSSSKSRSKARSKSRTRLKKKKGVTGNSNGEGKRGGKRSRSKSKPPEDDKKGPKKSPEEKAHEAEKLNKDALQSEEDETETTTLTTEEGSQSVMMRLSNRSSFNEGSCSSRQQTPQQAQLLDNTNASTLTHATFFLAVNSPSSFPTANASIRQDQQQKISSAMIDSLPIVREPSLSTSQHGSKGSNQLSMSMHNDSHSTLQSASSGKASKKKKKKNRRNCLRDPEGEAMIIKGESPPRAKTVAMPPNPVPKSNKDIQYMEDIAAVAASSPTTIGSLSTAKRRNSATGLDTLVAATKKTKAKRRNSTNTISTELEDSEQFIKKLEPAGRAPDRTRSRSLASLALAHAKAMAAASAGNSNRKSNNGKNVGVPAGTRASTKTVTIAAESAVPMRKSSSASEMIHLVQKRKKLMRKQSQSKAAAVGAAGGGGSKNATWDLSNLTQSLPPSSGVGLSRPAPKKRQHHPQLDPSGRFDHPDAVWDGTGGDEPLTSTSAHLPDPAGATLVRSGGGMKKSASADYMMGHKKLVRERQRSSNSNKGTGTSGGSGNAKWTSSDINRRPLPSKKQSKQQQLRQQLLQPKESTTKSSRPSKTTSKTSTAMRKSSSVDALDQQKRTLQRLPKQGTKAYPSAFGSHATGNAVWNTSDLNQDGTKSSKFYNYHHHHHHLLPLQGGQGSNLGAQAAGSGKKSSGMHKSRSADHIPNSMGLTMPKGKTTSRGTGAIGSSATASSSTTATATTGNARWSLSNLLLSPRQQQKKKLSAKFHQSSSNLATTTAGSQNRKQPRRGSTGQQTERHDYVVPSSTSGAGTHGVGVGGGGPLSFLASPLRKQKKRLHQPQAGTFGALPPQQQQQQEQLQPPPPPPPPPLPFDMDNDGGGGGGRVRQERLILTSPGLNQGNKPVVKRSMARTVSPGKMTQRKKLFSVQENPPATQTTTTTSETATDPQDITLPAMGGQDIELPGSFGAAASGPAPASATAPSSSSGGEQVDQSGTLLNDDDRNFVLTTLANLFPGLDNSADPDSFDRSNRTPNNDPSKASMSSSAASSSMKSSSKKASTTAASSSWVDSMSDKSLKSGQNNSASHRPTLLDFFQPVKDNKKKKHNKSDSGELEFSLLPPSIISGSLDATNHAVASVAQKTQNLKTTPMDYMSNRSDHSGSRSNAKSSRRSTVTPTKSWTSDRSGSRRSGSTAREILIQQRKEAAEREGLLVDKDGFVLPNPPSEPFTLSNDEQQQQQLQQEQEKEAEADEKANTDFVTEVVKEEELDNDDDDPPTTSLELAKYSSQQRKKPPQSAADILAQGLSEQDRESIRQCLASLIPSLAKEEAAAAPKPMVLPFKEIYAENEIPSDAISAISLDSRDFSTSTNGRKKKKATSKSQTKDGDFQHSFSNSELIAANLPAPPSLGSDTEEDVEKNDGDDNMDKKKNVGGRDTDHIQKDTDGQPKFPSSIMLSAPASSKPTAGLTALQKRSLRRALAQDNDNDDADADDGNVNEVTAPSLPSLSPSAGSSTKPETVTSSALTGDVSASAADQQGASPSSYIPREVLASDRNTTSLSKIKNWTPKTLEKSSYLPKEMLDSEDPRPSSLNSLVNEKKGADGAFGGAAAKARPSGLSRIRMKLGSLKASNYHSLDGDLDNGNQYDAGTSSGGGAGGGDDISSSSNHTANTKTRTKGGFKVGGGKRGGGGPWFFRTASARSLRPKKSLFQGKKSSSNRNSMSGESLLRGKKGGDNDADGDDDAAYDYQHQLEDYGLLADEEDEFVPKSQSDHQVMYSDVPPPRGRALLDIDDDDDDDGNGDDQVGKRDMNEDAEDDDDDGFASEKLTVPMDP